jgi:polysaccharide pyruvyl transferase WcaK-like protein
MKRKKVIISGYYGFDNIGDEAILESIIDNIRDNKKDVDEL